MKGVVLAAGKGSRLYPVTHIVPKPLLPLANRPTLHYAFDRLKEMGVAEVCVVVGENERAMREALGDGADQGVRLSYVRQTDPKGLAHALSFARDFCGEEPFCLYLGDALYGDTLLPHANRFLESGAANLNLVKPVPDPSRFGVANVEGERIVKLVEKPKEPESNLAMAGLYFFRPPIWSAIEGLPPSGRGEYEITDAIQRLVDRGETVLAGVYEGEWFDTGTLDSFLETTAYLLNGENRIAGGLVGTAGRNVVVGPGASVECEAIEDSVVLPGATVKTPGKIRRAILGGEVSADGDLSETILHGAWRG